MKKNNDYELSTGNVFADLGFADAEERLAKAELARQINNLIKENKLTQVQAAKLLEIDQPKISALNKGKLAGFSLERLFRFLTILGQNVIIKVSPKARSTKKANVSVSIPKLKLIKKPIIKRNNVVGESRSIQAKKRK